VPGQVQDARSRAGSQAAQGSNLFDAALSLAGKGIPVFPCGLDKKPRIRDWPRVAACDPEQVRAWWTERPGASIGCPTGPRPPGNGCWVLDIDQPEGPASLAALEAKHGPLPPTVEQRTGGGGRQVFFRYPEGREIRNSAGKLGPGLDVRGAGGYVILPPSGHPSGGRYSWTSPNGAKPAEAPTWLLDLVRTKDRPEPKPVSPLPAPAGGTAYGRKALEDECEKVMAAPPGTRNDTLNRAAFALGQLVAGGQLDRPEVEDQLRSAAIVVGLSEHEIQKSIASGLGKGIESPRAPEPRAEAPKPAGQTADAAKPAPSSGLPFSIRPDGVHFLAEDQHGGVSSEWLCSPLEVRAATRNADGEDWGRLLWLKDREGREHLWAMPMSLTAGSGDEYRAQLLSLGLDMAPGRKAKDRLGLYLSTARAEAFARCVSRIGWHGRRFVLPDAVCGEDQGETILLQGQAGENLFRQAGTLAEWQGRIGRKCIGNSRLALAVSAALAAPLLHPGEQESGGFHLVGPSSVGKTTALQVAGSVCGGGGIRGYVRQWRATDNALESVAAAHCDALLCLDEMNQLPGKAAGEVAYMLANGAGKARAKRDGLARKPQEWRVLFLSTGEITLADKVREDGRTRATAGQSVRVVDVPADAGARLGLFENLHGAEDGDRFARDLKEAAARFHGTALRAFLEALTRRLDGVAREVPASIRRFVEARCPADADGQVKRVAARFGLVAAAGELGVSLGVLPWPEGEATRAAGVCFEAWLEQRGGTGAAEVSAALSQVRAFFEAHGSSRFEDLDSDQERPIINRAGFRKKKDGRTLFMVLSETFRHEVCRGFDHKAVCRELVRLGILHPGSEGPAKTVRVRGETPRCYVLSGSILGNLDDAPEDENHPTQPTQPTQPLSGAENKRVGSGSGHPTQPTHDHLTLPRPAAPVSGVSGRVDSIRHTENARGSSLVSGVSGVSGRNDESPNPFPHRVTI
jgi:uncharacterized protein (DUF927 family)